jgi:DnaK suppressor protein
MAEKAANSYTKEFLFHQSDSERTQLNLVQKALERLRGGEFGLCQDCGESIDRKRLDAVPWAPFCRSCQEKAESSLRNDLQ